MLSEDDLDIAELNAEELAAAWDLWFALAQWTNDDDPPYSHGVFVGLRWEDIGSRGADRRPDALPPRRR